MPTASRLGAVATLQNAVATAVNGTALDITDAASVIVEISGTYTNITANFEASIDGGTTWFGVSLATLSSTTRARLAAATAVGLYLLENAGGLNSFRARTTIGAATGTMTVRAISSLN
jgi:hypothetical protein